MRTLFAWRKCGLTAALLLGCLAVAAQEVKEPGKAPAPGEAEETLTPSGSSDRTEQLAHLLKLTPAQKAKVKPLVDAETQQMKEVRGQKMTREERSRKFKALRDETYEKIKPSLTPEQIARWNQLRTFKPAISKTGTNAPVSAPVPPPVRPASPAAK
jgi:Spy/CpxP family protein refolding chaperone